MLTRLRDFMIAAASISAACLLVVHFLLPPPPDKTGTEKAGHASSPAVAATPATQAATPPELTDVTLDLRFNGKPLSEFTSVPPRAGIKPEKHEGSWLRPAFQWNEGRGKLLDVPEGRTWVSLNFDANPMNGPGFPGDFIAEGWLNINKRQNEYVLTARKFLHLTAPIDNNLTQGREIAGCAHATHSTPVDFAWERLSPSDVYEVSIRRVQCKPFDIGPIIYSERQQNNHMRLTLNPSGENDFYMLEIQTFNEHGELSKLQINGGSYTSWEHRFKVN